MKKRKLALSALIIFLSSQTFYTQQTSVAKDSTTYKKRKLKIEEINFTSGYYQQDGDNAAVTGGVGDEHLTDVATTLNLSLSKYDKYNRKHGLKVELGVDVYTSASSDKIDPSTVSSASKGDVRVYPSLQYSLENNEKRYAIGGGLSFSQEYDYSSIGGNFQYSKWSKSKNSEITAKASIFLDHWKVIYPIELRPTDAISEGLSKNEPRNSYNLGIIFSQVVNHNLQMSILADWAYQDGLLATKFHRVYFNDGSLKSENLPDKRTKIPLGIRANYFLGDNIVLRSFYRYYWDDWDIKAHTISLEASYKITPFTSFAPFYRYYTQSAAEYFAPYMAHHPSDTYYTSDYDLSKFNSNMFGFTARFSNLGDSSFLKRLNALELRYAYYKRSNNLNAHNITVSFNFK